MLLVEEEYKDFKSGLSVKSVNVSGVKWEYITSGESKDVLLILNGGLRVADSAFKYVNLFKDAFKVVVPTYPPLTSLDEILEGVKKIIEIESNRKLFVLCQSYGGMIGECLIQKYPYITDRIIISGTGPIKATLKNLFQLKFRTFLISLLPDNIVSKIYKKNLIDVITYSESEKDFWIKFLNSVFDNNLGKKDALSHFKTSLDAIKNYSFNNRENRYKGDVLCVRGEDDLLIGSEDIDGLKKYYNQMIFKVISKAGHTSAFQNPKKFYEIVIDFLKEPGSYL